MKLRFAVLAVLFALPFLEACNLGQQPPGTFPIAPISTAQNPPATNIPLVFLPFVQQSSALGAETVSSAGETAPPLPAPVTETPAAAQNPSPTEPAPTASFGLFIDSSLPASLRSSLRMPQWLAESIDPAGAHLVLTIGTDGFPIATQVYVLAAPFPSFVDEVSFDDLRSAWRGEPSGPFKKPLLLTSETYSAWEKLWGSAAENAVRLVSSDEILSESWQRESFALLPFDALVPRWKVLSVDGISPLHKDFDLAEYPLALPLVLQGDASLLEVLARDYAPGSDQALLPASNRDPARLTTVALTGVTALVRATAHTMERRGITYPATDVGDVLRDADITHISNEVPFARDCPFPDPVQVDLRFCSDPKYIALLEEVGADVIELTGDHFADWGRDAMDYTLDLYEDRHWPVYGGGRNLEAGRAALRLEHNGNRIAFIGCNAKGGSFAQAGSANPGAVACDFDWMEKEIKRLRKDGYLVIATFQHYEYYTYAAQPNQIIDSERLAEAGAVVVSGSQAHQPQSIEFFADAFIHYGLGNLFFDQFGISEATRQGFIDRHVFYDGRYLGVELLPILFLDYARPRPMTPDEADDLLRLVFSASGW